MQVNLDLNLNSGPKHLDQYPEHYRQDLSSRVNIATSVRHNRAALPFLSTQTDPHQAPLKCVSCRGLDWKSLPRCFLEVFAHQGQKPCRAFSWLQGHVRQQSTENSDMMIEQLQPVNISKIRGLRELCSSLDHLSICLFSLYLLI